MRDGPDRAADAGTAHVGGRTPMTATAGGEGWISLPGPLVPG